MKTRAVSASKLYDIKRTRPVSKPAQPPSSLEVLDQMGFQISHDLKDALKGICLNLELLLSELNEGDLTHRLATNARENSQRLIDMTESLVAIAIASKSLPDEPVKMSDVVNEAILELASTLAQRNIQTQVKLSNRILPLDSFLMKEVWKKLLLNVPEGSQVEITEREEGNKEDPQPVFSISDNGSGVPIDQRPLLFRSIVRTRADRHTGLGLLFCRRVIERHQGRIIYEPLDPGSRFSFQLASSVK